jgi:hypothetical protein
MNPFGVTKNRRIYGNCQVQSPDGILMFRCDEKKANWYLNRDLGEIVSDDPLTIRLKFEPNGLGNHNKDFGLSEMKNQCVVCGGDEFLTRHHVVPYCYRRYFPLEVKSHNFHDVLSLCVECHENYERFADKLKLELADEHNAPINGEVDDKKDSIRFSKIASTLLRPDVNNIPKKRIIKIKSEVKNFFGIKRLTKKRIKEISSIRSVLKRTHGEMVMENISDIQSFVEMWREHFIENMNCQYLPKDWKIKNNI